MKFGVGLRVRYEAMRDVAVAADELGFESVWLPEHLVFPASLDGSPIAGDDHPPVDPTIPTLDNVMFLVTLAQATQHVRLGTWVYNLALRHPLVSGRAFQTLDVLSDGRAVVGVGAGWIEQEYQAAGVDFASRGRRLNECIDVLRELWSSDTPSWDGEFFTLPPVKFEPKPPQGAIPIHVGGESRAALRRAATRGDGWLGMGHSPETARQQVAQLRELQSEAGRATADVEVTVGGSPTTADEVRAYADAGVDRLIVSPWRRTAEAVEGLQRYAADVVHPYREQEDRT